MQREPGKPRSVDQIYAVRGMMQDELSKMKNEAHLAESYSEELKLKLSMMKFDLFAEIAGQLARQNDLLNNILILERIKLGELPLMSVTLDPDKFSEADIAKLDKKYPGQIMRVSDNLTDEELRQLRDLLKRLGSPASTVSQKRRTIGRSKGKKQRKKELDHPGR